ncbi:MAG: hypothetical protein LUM44_14635 [Pyrinomonadaceae bacterium]|nr:hypothetical protein [Pyrinomonadaceae bacterium]
MIKEFWLNLPVKDINKSKEFFTKIGFTPNENQPSDEMCGVYIGEKKMSIMLVKEETFQGFAQNPISDAKAGTEILISFDAASREEVDETASKVFDAGGTIFSEPAEVQGWMYGFAFIDLDGHRWNQLYLGSGTTS